MRQGTMPISRVTVLLHSCSVTGVKRKARRDDRGECEKETNKKWKESEDEVLENLEVPYTSDMFKENRDTYIPKNSLEYLDYYNNAKMETE